LTVSSLINYTLNDMRGEEQTMHKVIAEINKIFSTSKDEKIIEETFFEWLDIQTTNLNNLLVDLQYNLHKFGIEIKPLLEEEKKAEKKRKMNETILGTQLSTLLNNL